MNIRIIYKSRHQVPAYSTECDHGRDIRTNITENVILKTLGIRLRNKAFYIQAPYDLDALIRPLSGQAIVKRVTVINASGTIDSDCRREVCEILVNLSAEEFVIQDGDRISRMIIANNEKAEWNSLCGKDDTDSGARGFGHTVKK